MNRLNDAANLGQQDAGDELTLDDDDAPMLMQELKPIKGFLDDPDVIEVVVNRPGEVWVERFDGWKTYEVPAVTIDWCKAIGKQIATPLKLSLNADSPFLSARLPTGERIQMVVPPAVAAGCISITIRKPSTVVRPLSEFIDKGMFKNTKLEQSITLSKEERAQLENDLPDHQKRALELVRNKEYAEFFKLLVESYSNIAVSGQTGAGKTSLANALIALIPKTDRLITTEDVAEARIDPAMNFVNMFYVSAGQSNKKTGAVTPKQVFESTLRMRPDRILPAELRGDETFFFIQNVLNSGHPGTITTGHANTAKLWFLRVSLMIKTSPEGAGLTREDILAMLYMLIDCVVQIVRHADGSRSITEIYYDPAFARKQMG